MFISFALLFYFSHFFPSFFFTFSFFSTASTHSLPATSARPALSASGSEGTAVASLPLPLVARLGSTSNSPHLSPQSASVSAPPPVPLVGAGELSVLLFEDVDVLVSGEHLAWLTWSW